MKSKLFLLSLTAIILSGCGEQNSSVTSVSLSTSEPTSSTEETSLVADSSSLEDVSVISSSDTSSAEESSQSEESSSSSADDDLPEYYRDKGLDITETGATLKTQLFNIINSHTDVGYSGLYTHYMTTDVKYIDDDGKKHLWDMYSACDYLMPDDENHSNYTKEGDNYNREHTIPQSIFSKKAPMVSDIFHVYPTDSFVNGKRGDHPHAEVATASFTSSNGTKVGTSATNNVSGTVCEPADEYKGDFARTYFYFVTCYQDKLSGFGNFATFSKNTYPSLATWAIQLYKKWSDDDPVSQKEIDRNNAAYLVQGNRNPFIDFPNIEDQVWNNY